MDSMDWFDPAGSEARSQIRRLNTSMKVGGRVLLRSAGLCPWYLAVFEEEGYAVKRVGTRTPGACIDRSVFLLWSAVLRIWERSVLTGDGWIWGGRVNMYASTYICTKRRDLDAVSEEVVPAEVVPATVVVPQRTWSGSVDGLQL